MSEIRDRVRARLAAILWSFKGEIDAAVQQSPSFQEIEAAWIETILSIPDLAVVDREAELPPNPYPQSVFPMTLEEASQHISAGIKDAVAGSLGRYFYNLAQQDMLNAGWVKEVKDE